MNLRLSSLRAMFNLSGASRLTAAAVSAALACAGMGSAAAATGDAASAPDAASVSYANGGQVTVRPGQSLNDVAIAVTQSHDKATLARASRALFDANPNAFMSHDPSRLRLGAVLTVPVLDASGALAASAAGVAAAPASAPNAASATSAASAVAQVNAAAASAATPAAPAVSAMASAATEASSATPGSTASSAPIAGSQAAALPASGTHEWTGSIQPSASEAEGASSAGAGTTPATTAAQPASQPRAQVSSLQQLLALKNRVLMELQKHGIGGTPPATNTASTGVAQPVVGVSSAAAVPSHGATPVASTSSDAGMSQTELSVAAAIGAALVALLAALRMGRRKRERLAAEAASADDGEAASARATGPQDVVSTRERVWARGASDVGDDSAVGNAAALAAAEREAAEGDAAAREMAERVAAERDAEIRQAAAREAAEKAAEQAAAERAAAEQAAAEHAAAERTAAERAAAERAAAERTAAEQAAAERAAAERTAAEQAAAEHAAAERTAAEQAEAEHAAAERTAAEQAEAERAAAERATGERAAENQPVAAHTPVPSPDLNAPDHISHTRDAAPESVEPAQLNPNVAPSAQGGLSPEPFPAPHHDDFDSATTAASLAAAAELGADALPLAPLEPVDDAFLHEEPAHRLQWDDTPAARLEPSIESQRHLNVPPPVDLTQPHSISEFGQSHSDAASPVEPLPDEAQRAHSEPAHEPLQPVQTLPSDASPTREPEPRAQPQSAPAAVPSEFPRDAVDAFGSLDMPLPPRVESSADALPAPASLSSQPVASPETTAQQAVPLPQPDDETPHIADEITAGTAGHAAVAGLGAGFGTGLGAAGFGALKLDFDLELPPSPAQPLPAFTQNDLSRIARNKLELAAEYIELGDLSGARTLINEVIETNDPGTRTEARALLSTLAPLS
ncbi:fimbrial protein FimV [Paraburkholderia dipogonis]|uniref:Fimbrial protein FimV n=1 Tax=Paraburkholderia dipogonis TaxID=1211383 RepID=A0A4Y8MRU7_9BURK|nr:FimV/HubP family polar landmark protein [Paraburkholderia dipogonis]TFE40174.1 fimbrial protein FimV [Paraburkholderia dipogonis]